MPIVARFRVGGRRMSPRCSGRQTGVLAPRAEGDPQEACRHDDALPGRNNRRVCPARAKSQGEGG